MILRTYDWLLILFKLLSIFKKKTRYSNIKLSGIVRNIILWLMSCSSARIGRIKHEELWELRQISVREMIELGLTRSWSPPAPSFLNII